MIWGLRRPYFTLQLYERACGVYPPLRVGVPRPICIYGDARAPSGVFVFVALFIYFTFTQCE